MIYKDLGKSSIKISALGFGGGIGGAKSDVSDYSRIEPALYKSLDLGVNFIDTSPVYGNGSSEEIIGTAIKGIREDLVLATKVLPGKTDYQGIMSSVEESLRRLKTDYIDLYQVHWPNPSIPLEETASAMEKLLEQGKIRHFGVSNFSIGEIKKTMQSLSHSSLSSIQVEYNFCERSIEKEILPLCKKNKVTGIAYTPLMRGRIAGNATQISLISALAKKYNATPGQIVLSWFCNIPSVVVLTNTKKVKRAKENFSACDIFLSKEDTDRIDKVCVPPVKMIDTKYIFESSSIERSGYTSLEEAIKNSLRWTPSPSSLAEQMKTGEFLKPIRLRKVPAGLEILEGKLRFWSWVVAHGWDKKIPSIIWEE